MLKLTTWGQNDEAVVLDFEQQIGVSLPSDYRNFLVQNNGGRVDSQSFFVKDLDQEILLDVLFGITNSKARSLTLSYWLNEYGDELQEKTLIIGRDPGGRFLIYITEGEDKGIYYWDDTNFFPQSTEEDGNTYFVADSFAQFCDSLVNYTLKNS